MQSCNLECAKYSTFDQRRYDRAYCFHSVFFTFFRPFFGCLVFFFRCRKSQQLLTCCTSNLIVYVSLMGKEMEAEEVGVPRVCVCVCAYVCVWVGGASCWGVKSPLLFVTVDSAWLSEGPGCILQQRPLGASHCASARQ